MRKPDEIALAREILKYGAYGNANVDGFVFERLGIPEKRARYIYKKWAARNWAEYGTSLRLAWLTLEGVEAWTSILSICDATDDGKCDTRCVAQAVVLFTGGHYLASLGHSCCPEIRYCYRDPTVFHYEQNVFVTPCTIPLLE